MKCPRCGEEDDAKFHPSARTYCKACSNAFSSPHNEARRVRKKYGLTVEEYRRKLLEPCEICGRSAPEVIMCIDHIIDGASVGTLCKMCNVGIGSFDHDPNRLRNAATYVERTRRGYGTRN